MWIVLIVLSLVAAVVAAVMLTSARVKGGDERTDDRHRNLAAPGPDDAAMFPKPGEPSPHTPSGEPVPGSRDHRRRRGRA
jgi:hypothetical protein